MKIKFGLSPCPNDTFMFDAIFNNKIDTGSYEFEPVMGDVEQLNLAAKAQEIQVTKMSYFTFLQTTAQFQMLRAGGALGLNCGPLLISNSPDKILDPTSSIAIPGANTTANLLLTYALPEMTNKAEVLFSDIEQGVINGDYDFGLIIHESRFTYEDKGLYKVMDLGEYWEDNTQSAIPLGGIAIDRTLPQSVKQDIGSIIKASVEFAVAHPQSSADYVSMHAQEMDPSICKLHIDTYVNEYSVDLGSLGKSGVNQLISHAQRLELIGEVTKPLFVS